MFSSDNPIQDYLDYIQRQKDEDPEMVECPGCEGEGVDHLESWHRKVVMCDRCDGEGEIPESELNP